LAGYSSLTIILIIVATSLVSLATGVILTHLWNSRGNFLPIRTWFKKSEQRELEKSKRLESERMWAIYGLISKLSATLNYQRVLDTALDMSISALGTPEKPANRLVSAVLLFSKSNDEQPKLYVGAARRFTRSDMADTFPGKHGLLKEVIDEGISILNKNVAQDPELSQVIALQSCKAAYCIPLQTGLDSYGVLLYANPDPDYFNKERQEILATIGNQAVIAIQNAQLYQDLEQEKERMMEIQEEARKKLARDLHDGPTQSVAAIAMRVNFARRLIDRDSKAAGEELYKIEELARRTTKEIRHMLFTLRPLVLESQGLNAALMSMAEKMGETYNQKVIIDIEPEILPRLEIGKQGIVFYIAEEAATNARKHARADQITIRLKTWETDMALLEIQDNGVGFNVHAVDASYEHRGSLGMINMRERAELINGVLHIESAEGSGTTIQVVIPLTEAATERLRQGL
jgi:signal transduction histidine kinase